MTVFDLMAKLSLDASNYKQGLNEAEGSFSKFGSKIKSGLKTTAKVASAGVAAIGAATVAITQKAVKNYADYEQLVGGVETLFGDSANKVMANADKAFKTAGLSVNQYMETSIASAAALINSLEGDTERAAKLMDMSIIDMADNVNKMGTTMESVQNAYRGFSRGNFTMLDNLALGYAGTKEGMEALLRRASELKAAQGELREYSISSYSDIVEAIHVVQTEMGITGTTAREAEETITGSLSAVKAAVSNLITGLGRNDADLDKLINDVVESAEIAFDNILPVADKAIAGVTKLVTAGAPKLLAALPKLLNVKQIVPQLNIMFREVLNSLVGLITDPQLIENAVAGGMELFGGVVTGILKSVPKLLANIPSIITAIGDGIRKGSFKVAAAFNALFGGVDLEGEANKLRDKFTQIVTFATQIDSVSPTIKNIDYSKLLSEKGRTISQLDELIADTEKQITNIISTALEERRALREDEINQVSEYLAKLDDLTQEKLSIYRNQQLGIVQRIAWEGDTLSQDKAAEYLAKAKAAEEAANSISEQWLTDRLASLANQYQAGMFTSEADYINAQREAKDEYDKQIAGSASFYSEAVDRVSSKTKSWVNDVNSINSAIDKLNYELDEFGKRRVSPHALADSLYSTSERTKIYAEYLETLNKIDSKTWDSYEAFLSMLQMRKEAGLAIDDESKAIVSTIMSAFESLPEEMSDEASTFMNALIGGITDKIPSLRNAANMSVNEIAGVINRYFSNDGAELVKNSNPLSSFVNKMTQSVFEQFTNAYATRYGVDKGRELASEINSRYDNVTVVLEVDKKQLGKTTFALGNQERQRIGIELQ